MTTYEPGTVAVATVRGVEGVRVVRTRAIDDAWFCPEYQKHNSEGLNGWWPDEDEVTDVRPLVLLDLEAADYLPGELLHDLRGGLGGVQANLIADQIEAQTKPPRIPEPGLWGVVKDSTGRIVIRTNERIWRTLDGVGRMWDDIDNPTLIREGMES